MQIEIQKTELVKLLSRTAPVCDRKTSMPTLSSVLVTASENGTVMMLGTDLTISVTCSTTAEVSKSGSYAIPARDFHHIAKSLVAGPVKLAVKDSRLEIKSGRSKSRIPCMDGEDFPVIATGSGKALVIASRELSRLITQAGYAQSSDDTRPHLAGLFVEHHKTGGTVTMTATDGHRLAQAKGLAVSDAQWSPMLIPRQATAAIHRLTGEFSGADVEIRQAGSNNCSASFRWPGVELVVKLLDEQFPPYSKVIPSHHKKAIVNRQEFADAIKRVSHTADKGGIRLALDQLVISVESETPGVGESSESVDVHYEGEPITFGMIGSPS